MKNASYLPYGFTYLKDVDSTIEQDIRYASSNNFMGRPAEGYLKPVAIMVSETAENLRRAQKDFNKLGYSIVVHDAYRPRSAVEHFWRWANDINDTTMKDTYYPDYDDKTKLFSDGFIARYSAHSRGSAVDITLRNSKTFEIVDMGTIFDFLGAASFTANDSISKLAQNNRQLLKKIMEEHGFVNYYKEWWHYQLQAEPFSRTPEDHHNFEVR